MYPGVSNSITYTVEVHPGVTNIVMITHEFTLGSPIVLLSVSRRNQIGLSLSYNEANDTHTKHRQTMAQYKAPKRREMRLQSLTGIVELQCTVVSSRSCLYVTLHDCAVELG